MASTRQIFVNQQNGPVYVSVEPWPECFELEPGDRLTLIWDSSGSDEVTQVDFINEREIVVHPAGAIDRMQFLINGEPADDKSWVFQHR